jgi:Phytanoyl-CoA dioxygenase (PhyH)
VHSWWLAILREMVLSDAEVESFITDGFVHLRGAFSSEVAAACVAELWELLDEDRADPATWTEPVVRIAGSFAPAIVAAINTTRLTSAIDQLVGHGRWERRVGYGTFPIRFPSEQDPGDAGWHIDGSFEMGDAAPPWNYWVNLRSRQRALLVLMLYSDVSIDDAPTRIRVGSHHDIARTLVGFGEAGAPFIEVSAATAKATARPTTAAVGDAGDAYVCHPFLMHSATWPHRGRRPRFMGQPCIYFDPSDDGYHYDRPEADLSPCERAVRAALLSPCA